MLTGKPNVTINILTTNLVKILYTTMSMLSARQINETRMTHGKDYLTLCSDSSLIFSNR